MLNRIFTHHARRWALAGLAMTLAFVVLAGTADAFWKKKKTETGPARAANLQLYPDMDFYRGSLSYDRYSGWELDGRKLNFLPEARVIAGAFSGGVSLLRDGQQGLIQGYLSEETLIVYQVTLYDLDETLQQNRFFRQKATGLPGKLAPGTPR